MKTLLTVIALTALVTGSTAHLEAQSIGSAVSVEIHRGDADANKMVDYSDAKTMLDILFGGARQFVSTRDFDYNEDDQFNIADVGALLRDLQETGGRRSQPTLGKAVLGDANDDGHVDIADLTVFLQWLFGGGPRPKAPVEALDANRDGRIDIADFQALQQAVGG